MIKVKGVANLTMNYEVSLDMTETEFELLSIREQDELIDSTINWSENSRNMEVIDIVVDDLEEV